MPLTIATAPGTYIKFSFVKSGMPPSRPKVAEQEARRTRSQRIEREPPSRSIDWMIDKRSIVPASAGRCRHAGHSLFFVQMSCGLARQTDGFGALPLSHK